MIDGIFWSKRTYEAAQLLESALSGERQAKIKFLEALSTSDLPTALVPALNKKVLDAYKKIPVNWESFAEREIADDFRPQESAIYKFNSAGIPKKNKGQAYIEGTLPGINELGEYQVIGVEASETMWRIGKSGAKFALSWERIRNDGNLREIERAVAHLSEMARNNEEVAATSAFVWGGGVNTTTMTSGENGTNNNRLSGNGPLTAENLEKAFIQASAHKIDGTRARVATRYLLLIAPALTFTAQRILGAVDEEFQSGTTTLTGPNPLRGKFTIVENDWFPVLGGVNGDTTWAIVPAPGQIPGGGSAVGFLRGHENPRFFVRSTTNQDPEEGDFDLDAYETKIRHTASPVWRGINAGIVISNGSGS